MQPFETWLKADLQAPVTVKRIDGNLFSGDNQGNLVGVTVTDAGEPATLSGEVRGYFIRSDGNTVIMSGTIDGNKVTVVLPSACYTVVGQFSLVIKVGQVAVGACTGYVYQSNTDSTVDPEHVIPDIDQLLTRVEALEGRATTLEGDVSAQNNTINAIEDGLAIISDGNTHPSIPARGFVFVKNHSTLTTGLYRVTSETTAIGTNAPLSLSNLTLDSTGGLNALKSDLDSLNSKIKETYNTSVTGISAFEVLDNITIWLGTGLTMSADGKTLNQIVPSGFRPYFDAQFYTKVYDGNNYVDAVLTFHADGTITIATLFNSAISGIQPNYMPTKTFSYMRNPNI